MAAATEIDDKVNIFNNTVLNLYDTHAPTRKIKLKRSLHGTGEVDARRSEIF